MKMRITLAMAMSLSGVAVADEVKLTSGRVLEGIVRQEANQVVVETRVATIRVPAELVSSIVLGRTALHEYQERIAALGQHPEPNAVFDTALWASEHQLTRYVNTLLQWTIALDPDHAQARKMLDYVRYEGRWISTRERDELAAARTPKVHAEPIRPRKNYVRRTQPEPEISPGYVYFGIPPLPPPRGTQNHGYGSSSYSFAYPFSMSSGRTGTGTTSGIGY